MNIKERYRPYNFSATKCHVIKLTVPPLGIGNIEEKLPEHITCIKGIYVSNNISSAAAKVKGLLFLTLNEGILKNFQLPILNTVKLKDCSHPIPLNETIRTNAILYGYYVLAAPAKGTITIYLHYEERK